MKLVIKKEKYKKYKIRLKIYYALSKSLKLKISELSKSLDEWMVSQNDIVSLGNIPLIKPTQHPLDEPSKWMNVQKNLIGKIKDSDYIKTHY